MAYISKVANDLLCTPFDNKAIVTETIARTLSEEEFFENCFSFPIFKFPENFHLNTEAEYSDNYDYRTEQKEIEKQIYEYSQSNQNFEMWLSNFTSSKVYTVSGQAGTGKTTFINYLKYLANKSESPKVKWIILDMERAHSSFEWFGGEKTVIPTNDFSSAHKKVLSIILISVRNILFSVNDTDDLTDDQIFENIQQIISIYDARYSSKHPASFRFFDNIKEIIQKNDFSIVSKLFEMAAYCRNYFNEIIKKDTNEAIHNALDILTLLLRCFTPEDSKYIIVFDNLERFVSKHEIYNQTIVDIRKNVITYLSNLNDGRNIHKYKFKFLMVVRNSTAGYGERLQSLDELASRLDITGWFDIHDIIYKKEQWFRKINYNNDDIALVKQIVSDQRVCLDGAVTGLKLQIDPLFNNNIRLIIDFVGMLVESPQNRESIFAYKSFLKKTKVNGELVYEFKKEKSIYRFAARSIIRGLILEGLKDSDNLFEHLQTYTAKQKKSGLGITRKILTILYNYAQNDGRKSFPLENVVQELLHTTDFSQFWGSEDANANRIRMLIAEVLFCMNSYNRRDNDWIQFVDLQFKDSNTNITVESPQMLCDMLSTRLPDFMVSILPGGIAYLKYIVASFEFFSVRYTTNKSYKPLFVLVPTPDVMRECINIEDLPCVQVVRFVKEMAMRCIGIMVDSNDDIKLNSKTFHSERIVTQHSAFLNSFISYIEYLYLEDSNLSPQVQENYKSLIERIFSIRNEYFSVKR